MPLLRASPPLFRRSFKPAEKCGRSIHPRQAGSNQSSNPVPAQIKRPSKLLLQNSGTPTHAHRSPVSCLLDTCPSCARCIRFTVCRGRLFDAVNVARLPSINRSNGEEFRLFHAAFKRIRSEANFGTRVHCTRCYASRGELKDNADWFVSVVLKNSFVRGRIEIGVCDIGVIVSWRDGSCR